MKNGAWRMYFTVLWFMFILAIPVDLRLPALPYPHSDSTKLLSRCIESHPNGNSKFPPTTTEIQRLREIESMQLIKINNTN
ncbi:hypothetical protein C8J55DRAFT_511141 [Lentinula edodes]|uniref:Uncharacterized protein n=1 Tax=Lentinula lateritia TaxID=40482 RepID=A0A9W9AHH8_9AGAR|nr:hypothetical protein C8J55DRAFT_511141 [Lentinula edodes]